MGSLLHFDFDIHNAKKITANSQHKKAKKDPEMEKVNTAHIL